MRYNSSFIHIFIAEKVIKHATRVNVIIGLLKDKRKKLKLTQQGLAEKAGVGLRFSRDLEQGKATLRMDKVNQELKLFGQELGPLPVNRI
jgi:y4mF family transcriptional regulator